MGGGGGRGRWRDMVDGRVSGMGNEERKRKRGMDMMAGKMEGELDGWMEQ